MIPFLPMIIGAVAGAALKPNDPLRGAMLGATIGFTGGTALGIGAGTTAAAGSGLTGSGVALGGTGTGTALTAKTVGGTLGSTGLKASSSALGGSLGSSAAAGGSTAATGGSAITLGTGANAGLSAVPASTKLIDPVAMGQREALIGGNYSLSSSAATPSVANYSLVAPSPVTSPPTPTFMDQLSMSGKSAYENPMMTMQALNATQGLLAPEQIASAPAVPIQARGQLRPFNPMESMDPYRQSVISNQPISLLG
jgi:hypothetical protein